MIQNSKECILSNFKQSLNSLTLLTEEFIYNLWQFKRWKRNAPLLTLDGQEIEVLSPGQRNTNAGPDFVNAKIKIGGIHWVGNVEIHINTSDWILHGHPSDEAYKNIILHIVYQHNTDAYLGNFPTLEIAHYIPEHYLSNYHQLNAPTQWIPCESLWNQVDDFTRNQFLETLFIERLFTKSEILYQRLQQLKGDWEALCFERFAYVFGLKINAVAFELMAKSFDFSQLQKIKTQNGNIEALIMGQSGFLDSIKDDYQKELHSDYQYFKHKFSLNPIESHLFKFLRLRPPNFPTIRLAQLAALYQKYDKLFQSVIHIKSQKDAQLLLGSIKASDYWDNHYRFGQTSTKIQAKKLSFAKIDTILINLVLPLQFLYAQQTGKENLEEILKLALDIPSEKNHITRGFKELGVDFKTAFHSQAYIELKNTFCDEKKCLTCRIGNKILDYAG